MNYKFMSPLEGKMSYFCSVKGMGHIQVYKCPLQRTNLN